MKSEQMNLLAGKLVEVLHCPEKLETVLILLEEWNRHEKEQRRSRQKDGLEKAKKKGVVVGRPRIKEPVNFDKICRRYLQGDMSAVVAAEACGMGVSTFYRRVRDLVDEEEKRGEK